MIKINEIKYRLLFIIKLIIIHFGKNPKKGGSPPKEKKLIKIEILI